MKPLISSLCKGVPKGAKQAVFDVGNIKLEFCKTVSKVSVDSFMAVWDPIVPQKWLFSKKSPQKSRIQVTPPDKLTAWYRVWNEHKCIINNINTAEFRGYIDFLY